MTIKGIVGSAFVLAAILIGAIWSNNILDNSDIAADGAFTIQQRKENAARNQADWDRTRPKSLWRRIFGAKSPPLNLAIEIKRGDRTPFAKHGFVVVTNLANDTVTITRISVNRRTDDQCSTDPANREGVAAIAAIIDKSMGDTPTLKTGHSITVGTNDMINGRCGSIFVVSVDTDKGSADYEVSWR